MRVVSSHDQIKIWIDATVAPEADKNEGEGEREEEGEGEEEERFDMID